MKKILLSIFAVLFAFAGVHSQETKTYTYDFSTNTNWVTTKGGSTNVAVGSSNKLGNFYYSTTGDVFNANATGYFNNNYFLWGKSGAYIELPIYQGEKITNVTAKSSSGHSTSVNVGVYSGNNVVVAAKTWSTNSSNYSYDIPEEYQTSTLRLQITNSKNSQIVQLVITTVKSEGPLTYDVALPSINVVDESRIDVGTQIVIDPAVGNTITYSVNGGNAVEGVTETTTITADKAGVMTLSIASTCNDETLTAEYTYYVKPAMPTMTDVVGFEENLNVEIEGAGVIYYTLNGDDPTTESDIYDGAITITETTTVKAIAVVDGVESDIASVTYAKLQAATPGYTVDMLTLETTGASGTNYKEWEGKTLSSTAVYAGESAGGNDAIQLRATNPSGVVTTVSGGKAVKVVVTWNSSTADSRTLDIYGKNSAYESPADLYSTSTRGTKIGSIAKGSTTLEISGDYLYIGIRSNSGALYLDDIEITWANPYKLKVSEVGYATMFLGFDAAIPTIEGDENGVFTATESETAGYVHLNSVEGVLPAETGVIVKAAAGTYEFWPSTGATADVTGNMLTGTIENAVITKDAEKEYYILANGENGVGLYKPTIGGDATQFNNAANKAYLVVPAAQAEGVASYSFRFGEGTTGVDELKVESGEMKVIYDLTGRRVEEVTAPGIYIINGVKVLVK